MNHEEQKIWDGAWKMFDSLDEAGKYAIAAVFLDTPETGKDSEYHREFKRRGYTKFEGAA